MFSKVGKLTVTVASLAAIAVGASAVAGAASNSSSNSSGTAGSAPQGYGAPPQGYGTPPQGQPPQGQPPQGQPPQGRPPRGAAFGRHKPETPLTGDVAAKVTAAAKAKVPGGTIERVETDSDHGSPYEAHVRKADGTELEVLVNKSFQVTAVNTMRHP
jgi:hypothetical protein